MNSQTIKLSPEAAVRNYDIVKNHISMSENPNPLSIILTLIVLIIGIYFIYVLLIKATISGKWISYKENIAYNITQCPFSDNIMIVHPVTGKETYGSLNGGAVYLDNANGIIKSSIIYWSTGDYWIRAKK